MRLPSRSSFLVLSSLLSALVGSVSGQQPAAAPPTFMAVADRLDLQDGDACVFLGDSITHQCLYTQYLEDYYYTRYPKLRLRFHNAGVGGDRASNALARFDEDVAAFKPKCVTILLGMNDGGYTRYEQPIFDAYQRDMTTVLDRISQIGATAAPITPTMHDARSARMAGRGQEPRDTYYNGVLALYGAWLREEAQVRGLGFVDAWSPLNDLTIEKRKTDPAWTMIKDAVHPGPAGHAVMAVAIVHDMVPPSKVSEIVIGLEEGQLTSHLAHGILGDLQKTEKGLRFNFAAESLPWVLPPEAAEGVRLARLGREFSNEKLTIRNLTPGKYELKIDGAPVGLYADAELGAGVELEENEKTPEYQQALRVAMLNKKRNDEAVHPLRDQWAALKGKQRDLEKAKEANAADLAEQEAALDRWLVGFHAAIDGFKSKAQEFENQIYQANQPIPHQYELTLQ